MSAAPAVDQNPFRRLWDLGYRRLVPIVPPLATLSEKTTLALKARGKAVGTLGSDGWHGFNWHVHETTPEDLDRWHAMQAGIGLRTGEGLTALDIDTLDDTWARTILELARARLGVAPRRVGRAPKVLLPYRVAPEDVEAVSYRAVLFDDGTGFDQHKSPRVELLCAGRQFVMAGIHPDTLALYRWLDGIPAFDALPVVTAAQVEAFFAELAALLPAARAPRSGKVLDRAGVDQETLRGPAAEVVRLVSLIPNDEPTYDGYARMAAAIRGASADNPDDGLEAWLDWCARWDGPRLGEGFDEKTYWSIKPPFGLGLSWLRGTAARASGECQMATDGFFETVTGEVDTSAFPAPPAEIVVRSALHLERFDDVAAQATQDGSLPLIKGLLDQNAMTILYGESNVGKTFVAMDIAYHVASGRPWGGLKTTRMAVVYVAAEGGRGARRRCAALSRKYGPCVDFYLLLAPVDLLRADADLPALVAAVRALGVDVGLLVVDTLSRALAGGDENASTDMGAIVRNLDTLRKATQAHLMVVHHSGKDKARGARGHSLLRAATDTEIEVEAGQIAVTKQRDLDKAWASPFTLDVVELGRDGDGDAITSCTVRLVARRAEMPVGIATPKEREVLEAAETCADTASGGAVGVSAQEIEAVAAGRLNLNEIRIHLRSLVAKNLLRKGARGRWIVPDNLSVGAFFKSEKGVFE